LLQAADEHAADQRRQSGRRPHVSQTPRIGRQGRAGSGGRWPGSTPGQVGDRHLYLHTVRAGSPPILPGTPRTHPARHPFLDHQGPLAFAHRGGELGTPENSMAAFEHAVRLGYRYLETDVHATADGVLVAFPDPRLDRVSDSTGAIAELPWRSVAAARIAGSEPIPRLEELLDAFPAARINIDVKAAPAIGPLVEVIRRTGAWDRVCAASFSDRRLAALRAAAGPRLALSLGPRSVLGLRLCSLTWPLRVDRLLGAAVRRRAVCVQVPHRIPGSRLPLVDRAFVRTAHRLGLPRPRRGRSRCAASARSARPRPGLPGGRRPARRRAARPVCGPRPPGRPRTCPPPQPPQPSAAAGRRPHATKRLLGKPGPRPPQPQRWPDASPRTCRSTGRDCGRDRMCAHPCTWVPLAGAGPGGGR